MSEDTKKSYIALGMLIISGEFLLETTIADHIKPNPLSPVVWAVLGAVAAGSLVAFFRYRAKAKAARSS